MAHTDNPNPAVVEAVINGDHPGRVPYREAVAATRALVALGYTDTQIATLIRRSARQVLRIRKAQGLPSLPVGTNGYTRRHDAPNPMRTRAAGKNLP